MRDPNLDCEAEKFYCWNCRKQGRAYGEACQSCKVGYFIAAEQPDDLLDFANADRRRANPARYVVPPEFGGATYDAERDGHALRRDLDAVKDVLMNTSVWLSLPEIAARARVAEGSVGSRVRDLRKSRHGSYKIPTKVVGRTWYYRMES